MTAKQTEDPTSVLDTLLSPLRLPQRVVAEIEVMAGALRSLSRTAEARLKSIDDHAGALVKGLGSLSSSLTRIERKVGGLPAFEQTMTERMEALREDLNTRVLAVESQVNAIRMPIDEMAGHVAKIELLLPEPGDGPMARLKDTLTKS